MIKKRISKSLSFLGVGALIVCNSCIPVMANTLAPNSQSHSVNIAVDDSLDSSASKSLSEEIVNSLEFMNKAVTITNEMIKEDNSKNIVEKVKKAQDFAGNTYTIIECIPSGYYILHDDTGQYIEFSDDSLSPYLKYDTNLYYGGPMEYYVNDKGKYHHTIDGTSIVQKDEIKEIGIVSAEINKRLSQKSNDDVVEYLIERENHSFSDKSMQNAKKAVTKASATAATYWVTNSALISRQNSNFGYVGGGCCGYIAANILLRYWRSRGKISFSFRNVTQLTKDLINEGKKFGYGYSSWGGSIANVINSYAKTKRFRAAAGSGVGSNYAYRELKNSKRPSILFGSLNRPSGSGKVKHAVVAYGLKVPKDTFNNFNTFVCHYGWNGYSKVNISGGLIGSCTSYAP